LPEKGNFVSNSKKMDEKKGYQWTRKPSGQYVDGHERADVVYYCQTVFFLAWAELDKRTRLWITDNQEIINEALTNGGTVVVWFHDESTFYENDCQVVCWVHKGENPVSCTKGEGASLMVVDFVSVDYGWLTSPDESEKAQVLFKTGKACEGYFMNEDILKHVATAMNILGKGYPDKDHVLVFDNTTTHLMLCQK
jgi:hypothetical protein